MINIPGHLDPVVLAIAEEFATREGIELTRYYDYIKSHCVHAFNGVQEMDRVDSCSDGNWVGVRVVVFLGQDGTIQAEVPHYHSKPYGHKTKEEAMF